MRPLAPLFVTAALALGLCAQIAATPADTLELSCAQFRDTGRAALVARFGAANVADAQLYVGEGYYEPGTVLFGDRPERRAELIWRTVEGKQVPFVLRITADKTQWRTPQGLTVGLDLATVERLNTRPFRLSGFGWDYGGTTISWSGGALSRADSWPCVVWARFGSSSELLTPEERRLTGQVQRDQEFSSGHPGVQAAHARVTELGLMWRSATPTRR